MLLDTSQLEVAERSPITAIENQQYSLWSVGIVCRFREQRGQ
jgi:BarA-like signal transduction histidine kinase